MKRPTVEDAVIALITVPMLASTVWTTGATLLPGLLHTAAERGFSPAHLAVAFGLAVLGVWLQALSFAGPVAASAAHLQWLVTADLLGHDRLLAWLVAGTVVLVVVAVAVLLARAMGWSVAPIAGSTAVLLVTAVFLAFWIQKRDAPVLVAVVSAALLIAALTVAAAQTWPTPLALSLGLGSTVALAIRQWPRDRTALRQLTGVANPAVPRWQLMRAHTNRWSVNAGILAMDSDIIHAVHESRAPSARMNLPAVLYRLPRPVAVATVVLGRALSSTMLGAAAAVVGVLLVDRLFGSVPALVLLVMVHSWLAVTVGRVAESWLASPALQRAWGQILVSLFAPVAVLALSVAVLAALVVHAPPTALLLLTAVGPLTVWRRHRARRSQNLTLLETPAGPIPLQTFDRAVAGYDVLAAATILIALL